MAGRVIECRGEEGVVWYECGVLYIQHINQLRNEHEEETKK